MDLDGSGAATLMLLNPTGGLLGGDVARDPGGDRRGRPCLPHHAGGDARLPEQRRARRAPLHGAGGRGARLEYVPDHLIPSPGARLRQTTDVMLAQGGALLLADAWAVGRAARGERWGFHELDLGLVVRDERGLILKERSVLDRLARDGLGAAEGFPYLATFAAIAPAWRAGTRSASISSPRSRRCPRARASG